MPFKKPLLPPEDGAVGVEVVVEGEGWEVVGAGGCLVGVGVGVGEGEGVVGAC